MANPQPGDTRIVTVLGSVRTTLNGVTKYQPGTTYGVIQTYSETGRLSLGGRDLITYKWVNTAFAD
jgi:hypothetical protein